MIKHPFEHITYIITFARLTSSPSPNSGHFSKKKLQIKPVAPTTCFSILVLHCEQKKLITEDIPSTFD